MLLVLTETFETELTLLSPQDILTILQLSLKDHFHQLQTAVLPPGAPSCIYRPINDSPE